MKIHKYDNYNQYVEYQTLANHKKQKNVWVHQTTIAAICHWYEKNIGEYKTVLCHGTRNGAEQGFFHRHTERNIEVLGTEISDTATNYKETIRWDFTKQKPEWVGYWDIVYSNSFDHSPTPWQTIQTWRDQLSHDGLLVIDHTVWNEETNTKPNKVDCLDISFKELEKMIVQAGMRIETKKRFNMNSDHMKNICESWFYFARRVDG